MSEEILRVEDLTKIYPGGVLANYKVNFSIDRGEIHALVGENGAGKSTLMKMLFGIEEITSGKVFLNGKEVDFRSSTDAIRAGIGMAALAYDAGTVSDRGGKIWCLALNRKEDCSWTEKKQFRRRKRFPGNTTFTWMQKNGCGTFPLE